MLKNKSTYIKIKAKIILTKIFIGFFRGLLYLKDSISKISKKTITPLGMTGRFLLWIIVLPNYKVYLSIKKSVNKFYAPRYIRNHLIHPFSRRYLTHIIIIIVSIFTVSSNLNAYENRRDELESKSIIGQLVITEDLGSIKEEGPITRGSKITRYIGEAGISSQPQPSEGEEISPPTTAGGSAVVGRTMSPIEEEMRQRDKIVYYKVQRGDTISEIAEKFGITTNTILWENNLTAYNLIRPGDTLKILPTSGIQHKVVKGDTLAKIANTYKVEVEKIIEHNKLTSADDIKIGESLMIPGGRKIQPAPAPAYTFRTLVQPTASPAPAPIITATGQMLWPTSCRTISQYFGWRHSGLDIACGNNAPIYAADSGIVNRAEIGYNGGYGNVIIIDHGGGKQTLYAHLNKIHVSVGENITKGSTIGLMGSTGRSTGPHLHFEVRIGGSRQNPLNYIK